MDMKDADQREEKKQNAAFDALDEFVPLKRTNMSRLSQKASDDLLQKNLESLGKYHPELVVLLESAETEEDRIKVVYSESGVPRISYLKDDGEEIYIHNASDPVECANQAADLLGEIEKEGIVVLFGFGLGYIAEEIFERFEKGHILLVYEATIDVFKTALKTRDFSKMFDSEQVKIVLGKDADDLSVIHSHHHLIMNGKFWIVKHHPSVKLNEASYENFHKRLNEEKRVSDSGMITLVGRGKEFMNAFLENIPSIVRKPGVKNLKDVFKGCPAIIVSAGPSLDKNLHLLKKAKGRALIIAVDGVLPTLLPCGIIPDIVVAIDPIGDNIDDKFKDIPILSKLPFVCVAQYTPEAIRVYPGPVFINSVPQNLAYQWLSGFIGDMGHIESSGGSVAHLAFAAAEFVGADKIAFVGQDLSFKGEKIHTVGYTDVLDRLATESIQKGLEHMPGAIPTVDMFGEKVFAISQFLSFRTSFENRIKEFKGVVVNATEAGLSIEGASNMRLVDFIEEHCSASPETDKLSLLSDLHEEEVGRRNLEGLVLEIKMAIDKYREIRKTSKKILKIIKKLTMLKKKGQKDSDEFHNCLKKVGPLIEKVKHPSLNLLAGYQYSLELYLRKQELQEIDEMEDKWERLDKQIDRGKNYYSEIVKATELFSKKLHHLSTALKREEEIDSILTDESIESEERFFKVGTLYKKAGMVVQAIKYFELLSDHLQSLEKDEEGSNNDKQFVSHPRIIDIQLTLAELYVKQFRFYDARETLKAISTQKQSPLITRHKARIKELLRTCEEGIKSWEKRKMEMGNLFKEAEANYGSHLESAYFYFRVKDYERAETAYVKAVEEAKEDNVKDEKYDGSKGIVEAYYGLAHSYLALEEPQKAVDVLEKAIKVDPENPLFYRDLGLISVQNKDFSSAEIFILKAIELAPQVEELYKLLSDLYISQGEQQKATSLYENALLVNADNPVIQQDLAVLYKDIIASEGRTVN